MSENLTNERVWVWGVPFAPITLDQTVAAVSRMIAERRPSFFITANTHYAMLTAQAPELAAINERAAFIVADGKPLVWASRWRGTRLPERVAGADLIFHLSEEAARRGYRVFLLGGGEGVAEQAAHRLTERYPGLQIVGTVCPPYRELTAEEQATLIDEIRAARPDLLIVAFTMPRGERWIATNLDALGVPVVVNVGAAIDFAAGRIRRAPRWMQRTGLEWAFRLGLEPRRLFKRYALNAWFIARMTASDLRRSAGRRPIRPRHPRPAPHRNGDGAGAESGR
jgi:N-acetylglucosaminyldiphosphoundecaprenol N-acetyl-beta-D-mannosaminyltransferase